MEMVFKGNGLVGFTQGKYIQKEEKGTKPTLKVEQN
jgi:hypothetical protein